MNRFRRLRATRQMRNLVAETTLSPKDFIYPMFVIEGENITKAKFRALCFSEYPSIKMKSALRRITQTELHKEP